MTLLEYLVTGNCRGRIRPADREEDIAGLTCEGGAKSDLLLL